jgi:hypothetical protein
MKLPILWQRAERGTQTAAGTARRNEPGANALPGDHLPANPYIEQWADIVLRLSNSDLLAGPQNALIFGAKAMGRQAVMTRVAGMVNARRNTEHCAAVYIDMQQMVSASTVYTWTSVDAVYRDLISAPLIWARATVGARPDRELQKLEDKLMVLLDMPVAKLDMLAARDAFYAWMGRLGIQTLSFFVDDVSSLAPGFIPVLLQMLLDTFPRGSRVCFKLAGLKQSLKLEERAKRGALGMQFSHDILAGLDLEQLLQSGDVSPSQFDPRQIFLLACIQKLAPALVARVEPNPEPAWGNLFDPPEAWFGLFKGAEFDIEIVGAALENLLPELIAAPDAKADPPKIAQAAERAKAQAGLRKPPTPAK